MFSLVMHLSGGTTLFPDGFHVSPLQLANFRAYSEYVFVLILWREYFLLLFCIFLCFCFVFVLCDHCNRGNPSACPELALSSSALHVAFCALASWWESASWRVNACETMSEDLMTSGVVHSPGAVRDDGVQRGTAVARGKL